ncbi:MAG: prepilin-type N-terminal cleavage/methylation domain-containing protein [Planctomycetota bacterium]
MKNSDKYNNCLRGCGFTLIEIILVVVILGIAALIAVPMVSSAADIQVRSAANHIAADIDYVKSMAITHQQSYSIIFDPAGESYEVHVDPQGTDTVIEHPVIPGDFVVSLSGIGLDRVNIVSADFDADVTKAITFDYLGSPYHGKSNDPADALNSGVISLSDIQSGNFGLYVKIEPMTGYVTIDDTP